MCSLFEVPLFEVVRPRLSHLTPQNGGRVSRVKNALYAVHGFSDVGSDVAWYRTRYTSKNVNENMEIQLWLLRVQHM